MDQFWMLKQFWMLFRLKTLLWRISWTKIWKKQNFSAQSANFSIFQSFFHFFQFFPFRSFENNTWQVERKHDNQQNSIFESSEVQQENQLFSLFCFFVFVLVGLNVQQQIIHSAQRNTNYLHRSICVEREKKE